LVGETVGEHVRRLRLERAALHLKYGEQPILNLALDAGFESHEAFTRAFKSAFGCPPVQFRRRHQELLFAAAPSGIHFEPHGDLAHFQPAPVSLPELDVRVECIEATPVLFHRAMGPYEESGPKAWAFLQAWAEARGLMASARLALGICHDDPDVTPPARIRFDAALATAVPVEPQGEVGIQEIPGGCYAVATFRGGPEVLDHTEAWTLFLGQWMARSSYRLSVRPSFESYVNDPAVVPSEDVVTELWAPIERP
jgi:AraC family transcriptional regulator